LPSEYWDSLRRRRFSRRTALRGAAITGVGAASIALVGCGDDDDDDDDDGGETATATSTATAAPATETATEEGTGTATGTATAEPTAEPTEEVQLGGIYHAPLVGISTGNPPTLYPFKVSTYLAAIPAGYHYSRLLRYTNIVGGDPLDYATVEGDAAESYEQPDETTAVFSMRSGIKYHNVAPVNGRDLNADDVLASHEAFLAAQTETAGQWAGVVQTLEAPDEGTIQVTLTKPYAPFLTLAASPEHLWIIPTEITGGDEATQEKPVGSGPWIFKEFVPDNRIVWEKNPEYFETGEPYMDSVEASLVRDPATIIANLESDTFDASLLDPALFTQVENLEGLELIFNLNQVIGGIFFNLDEAPWSDPRVRQAISLSLDRDGMKAALDPPGRGKKFSAISHLGEFFLDPDGPDFGENAYLYSQDLTEAQALLEAAGVSELSGLSWIYSPVYGPVYEQLFGICQENVRALGFDTTTTQIQYPEYRTKQFYGQFNNALAVGPLYVAIDPSICLFTVYHPESGRHNWGGALDSANGPGGDQEWLDMVAASESELDIEARVPLVHDIQRYMADKMWMVPYYGSPGMLGYKSHVKNFNYKSSFSFGTDTLRKVWLDVEA
jgi:peptide/nickel transport system substrate-binding protein